MTGRRRLSAVPDDLRHAVLYVRVSSLAGRGGDDFHSPDLQLDAMRALAARNGLLEVEVVQDIDRTGRDFSREGIDRIMHLARAGQVHVVACYDLSRFGRNTGESLRHISELRDLGVSVVSTVEQIDDSPEGQFMLGQFLGMAQLYSDQIGRRWQQVIEHRARQGRWHGSNPPLGYQLDPEQGLIPHPDLAPAMTVAFERYAKGHLVSHIARDLTQLRGTVTAVSTVKGAFRNPVYIGRVSLNGIEYPGRHPALVDERTWQRVQERLARDTRTPSRRLAVSHPLVGLVLCEHCRKHLQLHAQKATPGTGPRGGGARTRHAALQCRTRLQGGPDACPGPGAPVLAEVVAKVRADLPGRLQQLRLDSGQRAARAAERARANAETTRLTRELKRTQQAIATLTVDLGHRHITPTAYRDSVAELEATAAGVQARLDEVQHVTDAPPLRDVVKAGEALLALWDSPAVTDAERNRGLRGLVREITIRRAQTYREPVADRVVITWI